MTDSLLPANIFFIVATIAIIIGTVVCVVASVYIIRILQDVRSLSKSAKEEGDRLVQDIADIRQTVNQRRQAIQMIAGFIADIASKTRSKK